MNPLDPGMLYVQTANVLGWDLEFQIKSRNREQGRRNGKKTILCRNGPQKLHLNSVDFSKNRCDITRFVKGAYCGKKILCALKIITKCLNLYLFLNHFVFFTKSLFFLCIVLLWLIQLSLQHIGTRVKYPLVKK